MKTVIVDGKRYPIEEKKIAAGKRIVVDGKTMGFTPGEATIVVARVQQ
jgi:hypothetical protein